MKNKIGLVKRLGVLAILLFCLGFVMFAPNATQNARASECCSECAIPPGQAEPTPQEYCQDLCQVRNGPCVTACINDILNCWQWCDSGC